MSAQTSLLWDTVASSCVLSPCGLYRYSLTRWWGEHDGPWWLWVMLNPSTADDAKDDPTMTRVVDRTRRGGGAGAVVVNLYAFRSAYPRDLRAAADPIGPMTDAFIRLALAGDGRRAPARIVCAWGADTFAARREQAVRSLIAAGRGPADIVCLGRTKFGAPRHPLFVPRATVLVPYDVGSG